MIGAGENELICDFAETYHIYDYKSLPASKAAILAVGLRDDSRIKMKMAGTRIRLTDMLVSTLIDSINTNMYALRGIEEKPALITDELMGTEEGETVELVGVTKTKSFETGNEFEEEMKRLRGKA